jgi:hypothetical protein
MHGNSIFFIYDTAPNFIEEHDVKACDEIYVTAPIIRVMMVSDFLGKDQNANI